MLKGYFKVPFLDLSSYSSSEWHRMLLLRTLASGIWFWVVQLPQGNVSLQNSKATYWVLCKTLLKLLICFLEETRCQHWELSFKRQMQKVVLRDDGWRYWRSSQLCDGLICVCTSMLMSVCEWNHPWARSAGEWKQELRIFCYKVTAWVSFRHKKG